LLHSRISGSELSFSHSYPRFVSELGMKIILNKKYFEWQFQIYIVGGLYQLKASILGVQGFVASLP